MKRREQYGADTTTLPYAARMLVSAALLGGLTLGVVSTLVQIALLHQMGGVVNLAFLVPLAMICWAIVPRLWHEPTPPALRAVRSVSASNQMSPMLSGVTSTGARELALGRRL
jgi:hypothetical protein